LLSYLGMATGLILYLPFLAIIHPERFGGEGSITLELILLIFFALVLGFFLYLSSIIFHIIIRPRTIFAISLAMELLILFVVDGRFELRHYFFLYITIAIAYGVVEKLSEKFESSLNK